MKGKPPAKSVNGNNLVFSAHSKLQDDFSYSQPDQTQPAGRTFIHMEDKTVFVGIIVFQRSP